jgi:hypothetical protein
VVLQQPGDEIRLGKIAKDRIRNYQAAPVGGLFVRMSPVARTDTVIECVWRLPLLALFGIGLACAFGGIADPIAFGTAASRRALCLARLGAEKIYGGRV